MDFAKGDCEKNLYESEKPDPGMNAISLRYTNNEPKEQTCKPTKKAAEQHRHGLQVDVRDGGNGTAQHADKHRVEEDEQF